MMGDIMMKTVVIYKSKTGHTKQYASMIAEELECKAYPLKQMGKINLSEYDQIIFGGCVHASMVSGLQVFIKKTAKLQNKKIVLFAVGGNEITEVNTDELLDKNLISKGMVFPFFYMQGGFDPDKLGFVMRSMLNSVANSMKKKQQNDPTSLSEKDLSFLAFFQEKHNDIEKSKLNDLLSFAR